MADDHRILPIFCQSSTGGVGHGDIEESLPGLEGEGWKDGDLLADDEGGEGILWLRFDMVCTRILLATCVVISGRKLMYLTQSRSCHGWQGLRDHLFFLWKVPWISAKSKVLLVCVA